MKKNVLSGEDRELSKAVYKYLREGILDDPEKNLPIYISAIYALIPSIYAATNISYESFCSDVDKMKEQYKFFFNKKDHISGAHKKVD